MGYKGIRKLNNEVSAILEPFGIKRATYNEEIEYTYDRYTKRVTFKILEENTGDELFLNFIKDYFGYEVPNSFIISLLHEVGHHYTLKTIDKVTDLYCWDEKERISEELGKEDLTKEEEAELFYRYFTLPDEIIATEWAVKYAEAHPRKIKIMWNKVRETIYEFCENNDIFSED